MNFQELGLTLQRERERQGLTIEMVMEATKISRTNLTAIESGDRNMLPHPVYTKGFIKSYARHLNLDADELSMIVDREFQDVIEGQDETNYDVAPAAERALQEKDAPVSKKRSIWPMLLVVVFLIGVAVLLIVNLNKDDTASDKAPVATEQTESTEAPAAKSVEADEETAESVEEATPSDALEAGAAPTPDQEGSVEAETAPVTEEAKPEPQPETPPEAPVESATPPVEPQPAETASLAGTAEEETKPKYDHMLVIRATTEKGCWIGVWRGDETKMARDFVLKQGEPLRLMFNSARRIRIGNVAGVTVIYNGEPYALDATKGNIQTLHFGME